MITHFAYSTSDISFRSRQTLQYKERALLIILGVGVGAGLLIDVVIPQLVEPFADVLLVWGHTIASGGRAAWFAGSGTQLATIVTEHVVYWRLTGESLRT